MKLGFAIVEIRLGFQRQQTSLDDIDTNDIDTNEGERVEEKSRKIHQVYERKWKPITWGDPQAHVLDCNNIMADMIGVTACG